MARGRNVVAVRAEQLLEPALPEALVRAGRGRLAASSARSSSCSEMPLSSAFRAIGSGSPVSSASSASPAASSSRRSSLKRALAAFASVAELVALAVIGQHRQLRLGGPQRQLLSLPLHARGENPVLELVFARGEVGGDDPLLARLAQPVQELAVVAGRGLFRVTQDVELAGREEVAVPLDDRRLLRDLLLPDADRAPLLGPLEEVARETLLVLGGTAGRGGAHARGD